MGADVLGDGGARAARRDREPLEEPGRDVRGAEDRQLLVLVDLLAEPAGVAARQDAGVGERDERDPDRRGDQGLEVVEGHVRHAEGRQARGNLADDGHLIREAEQGHHRRRADHGHEHAGELRRDPPENDDRPERCDAERKRSRVCLVEPGDELAQSRDEALRADREPEQLGQLRDDHGDRDAHQVAEADGHRQQLGHEAEPRHPAGEHDRPDEDRQQTGERDPCRLVAARGERDDRRGHKRRHGRVGSQDEDPRRAQQEVHDERHQRRVQAGDRRQARELAVRHPLGHEQGSEDGARDDVAPQRRAAVASQQREPRHPTTETGWALHDRHTNRMASGGGRAYIPSR